MNENEIITFNQQFDNITEQAVKDFQDSILDRLAVDSSCFEENVSELLTIDDSKELFEYIINDDYWVRLWSLYLLRKLMDVIYE